MFKTDENLLKRFLGINIRIMKICGLYPFDNLPKWYFYLQAYSFHIFFICPTPVLSAIQLVVNQETDITKIAESAFSLAQTAVLIIKLLPFKTHINDIMDTMNALNLEIFKKQYDDQKIYINEAVDTIKKTSQVFIVCCVLTLISWGLRPFFSPIRSFPVDIWLPYDAFSNGFIFYSTYIFIWVGVANAVFDNAAVDTLIPGLIYHAASQIRILKDTLQHLGRRADEEISELGELDGGDKEKLRSYIIYKNICECVDHHNAIYRFVKQVESSFSIVVFSQFCASIVVICVCCLQMSFVEPFTFTFYAMVIYTSTVMMEIFLYCYYGTVLYEESLSIGDAIFMGTWYNYDTKSKRALLKLMERSKRPMIITVGKLLDLSLNTFTMILRRAYSLLAVLKNY